MFYLYRTRTRDNEGDPLDWGLIIAEGSDDAIAALRRRLIELGYDMPLKVTLYRLTHLHQHIPDTDAGETYEIFFDQEEANA